VIDALLIGSGRLDYSRAMAYSDRQHILGDFASKPSSRTLHAEMLRLCARIGYSPPPSR
jgi:hypothetical protein